MNKQGQCQTPERTHSFIHLGTALCLFVTVFVSMSTFVCVFMFDFQGICVFVPQDVKQEKDTTPVEETKRQRVLAGQDTGWKGMEIKLLWNHAEVGKCKVFQASYFWPFWNRLRPYCEKVDNSMIFSITAALNRICNVKVDYLWSLRS